jgi:hypothetical protein
MDTCVHVIHASVRHLRRGFAHRTRRGRLTPVLMIAALAPMIGAPSTAFRFSGTWSNALEMPGTSSLNAGVVRLGSSAVPGVNDISCPSADNCSAGGEYTDRAGHGQALLVDEVDGQWQAAIEAPGTAALNVGGRAEINSVSCASSGNCAAGGDFTTRSGELEAMVLDEVGGIWRQAIEVPSTGALNTYGDASVVSISCKSPGYCSAGGFFTDRAGSQAFVVDEVGGIWGMAEQVPGVLNPGGNAQVRSVSCASPGNCSAGGYYATGRSGIGAFIVSESSGVWSRAEAVPNSAQLDTGHLASLDLVSCSAVGFCGGVGDFLTVTRSGSVEQPFVVTEKGGVWGPAAPMPVPYRLIAAGQVDATALSCASPGNCTDVGAYWNKNDSWLVFAESQVNGVWRAASAIAGTVPLNAGDNGQVNSVSCGAGGYCAAAGFVTTARRTQQAFVVLETQNVWHAAEILPNSERLNTGGNAEVGAVSCTPSGFCGAGGDYTQRNGNQQLFVANFRP